LFKKEDKDGERLRGNENKTAAKFKKNQTKYLFLANIFSLAQYFLVRLELTEVEHLLVSKSKGYVT